MHKGNPTRTPSAPLKEGDLPDNVSKMIKRGEHRDDYTREERQVIYARLKSDGLSNAKIAEEMGITYQAVRELERQVRGLLRRSTVKNYAQYISGELDRLEMLEEEALGGWALSKESTIIDEDGKTVAFESPGNPKFLEIALKVIETRAKLFIAMKKELPAGDLENAAAILQIPEGANYAETLSAITAATKAGGKQSEDSDKVAAES